jgi:SWIM zinc finger
MEFNHRYAGQSAVSHGATNSQVSFAPDTLRDPTYFTGEINNHVPFREAISALHRVVVSDMRLKPKDRVAYFAWLETQKDAFLAEANTRGKSAKERSDVLRAELGRLGKQASEIMRPFYSARDKYFKWLYTADRDAWIVLDPVIAVHPDEIAFECFSLDESSYGRLACDLEMFDATQEIQKGVTNIDYSWELYNSFQQIRSYRKTELRIEPGGFNAATSGGAEIFQRKIDLPESWVRGFLQVSAAMAQPLHVVRLDPLDVHNICFMLRAKKERQGPRSIRVRLKPGKPVELLFEPWNTVLACPRSVYEGKDEIEIRIWGRRRLLIMERLIPIARSFTWRLMGSGLPSFLTADLGPMRFTLGLSGWSANDWSNTARFDLLEPRRTVSADTLRTVQAKFGQMWVTDAGTLAEACGLDRPTTLSALTLLTQQGRAIYDLDKGLWRHRELTREPLPFESLRFASAEDEAATALLRAGTVTLRTKEATVDGIRFSGLVVDDGRTMQTDARLDGDERIVDAQCTCAHFKQHKLHKGPCVHMLALRRAFDRDRMMGNATTVVKGPWGAAKNAE